MMSHELHTLQTFGTHLLPPTGAVRRTGMTIAPGYGLLQFIAAAPAAACPCGAGPASSVHRRDQRRLADRPGGTCPVRIQLTGRQGRCRHPSCPRRIFPARVPELVAAYARTTQRLITAL